MTYCQSDRGEWGKPCPDCGVPLPPKRRLTSWKAEHTVLPRFGTVSGRQWSVQERKARLAAWAERKAAAS